MKVSDILFCLHLKHGNTSVQAEEEEEAEAQPNGHGFECWEARANCWWSPSFTIATLWVFVVLIGELTGLWFVSYLLAFF